MSGRSLPLGLAPKGLSSQPPPPQAAHRACDMLAVVDMPNEQVQVLRYRLTDRTTLLIQCGDISTFTGDAVVCSGNHRMCPPAPFSLLEQLNAAQVASYGGSSGAIFKAAGSSLYKACAQVWAPCLPAAVSAPEATTAHKSLWGTRCCSGAQRCSVQFPSTLELTRPLSYTLEGFLRVIRSAACC